jgi:hypothetical protein
MFKIESILLIASQVGTCPGNIYDRIHVTRIHPANDLSVRNLSGVYLR